MFRLSRAPQLSKLSNTTFRRNLNFNFQNKYFRNFSTQNFELGANLCRVAAEGNQNELIKLLNANKKTEKAVDATDYDRRSALHIAASEGKTEIVKVLLSNGATHSLSDRFGRTPLDDAIEGNHQEIIALLRAAGAVRRSGLDANKKSEVLYALETSIPMLCERGSWEYAELWIAKDNQNIESSDYWYAVNSAASKFSVFRQEVENRTVRTGGEAPVSRAFRTQQLVWINSIENNWISHSAEVAKAVGIKSGLAFPVVHDGSTIGVFLFFSTCKVEQDNNVIDYYTNYTQGLVAASLEISTPRFNNSSSSGVINELKSSVFELIAAENVFNPTLVYQEIEMFFNLGLQQYYFERFTPQQIAKHVRGYIAAKKLSESMGRPEEITLYSEGDSEAFYLCPDTHKFTIQIETKLEALAQKLPVNRGYSMTFFRSRNSILPGGSQHLALYIFDSNEYVNPRVEESECDIWKISTGVFLRSKTPSIRDRYQELLRLTQGKISPVLQVYETYRDGTIPLMFAFKGSLAHRYMLQLSELLVRSNLTCERKFIETFANGMVVYSVYLHPCHESKITELMNQMSLLHPLPKSQITPLFFNGILSAEEYAFATAVSRFVYYFLSKRSEEFESIAKLFKDDPLNMGRLNILQNRLTREATSLARINDCVEQFPEMIRELYKDFANIARGNVKPFFNKELAAKIKRFVVTEIDEQILLAFINFNAHILRTNFYRQMKSAISFRLDPSFVTSNGNYPEDPFGLFWVLGSDFQGFHIRFRDIARGGIRIIRSANSQAYNRNLESQFTENYNLAYTQNKKNKDIPEFGSKGTVLLDRDGLNSPFSCFQRYTSGLLDLLTPHESVFDHFGQEEILFLGPDEGTADYMQWAALYAKKRNYRFWKAFTTGKPPTLGGIPHDTYGMTTRSVHRYVLGILEKLNLKEENITKVQTGGPDGDLGSNEILLSKDRTIAIIDGSGVVYDPEGLDRSELTSLAKRRKMVNEFDASKLSKQGFRVLVNERDITLPNGEIVDSGLTFRNEFHLNPILTADLFVPCGGRPEAINLTNVQRMFNKDGTPRFKYVVEGANLFLTQDARLVLERAGVIVFKDASTNKGGVTSSSFEVLAALAMSDAEHSLHMQVKENVPIPQFYKDYVQEIQRRIEDNAALEFECIWSEHERSAIPRAVITDKLSNKINQLTDAIQQSSLWSNTELRRKVLSEALPKLLLDQLGLETILKRIPESYAKSLFSTYLASRYVYQMGLSAHELVFFNFMQKYIN
eukprot:TRINITY_DN628_c1_g3_i1.p1 TRINITY_DN628_c1_g3~~TRINITY_DN628_c1_g3_i1.p1  ORF type:complete len:1261 (-),score=653.88 TRINITY_DN628_c1_g3_i1:144-3926(-)